MLAIDVRSCRISVDPPTRQDGIARMLAALSNAGIDVTQVEARGDDGGLYRLTVDSNPDLAVSILEALGCHARRDR